MRPHPRFLGEINSSTEIVKEAQDTGKFDLDIVVVLCALLCAVICVIGVFAVARCAWFRRYSGGDTSRTDQPSSANKGLKKKVIRSLPKVEYRAEDAGKLSDCAICLAEYVPGDEIRVLPQCGHGFHVGCIDTWLKSHSSCPSCRQNPVKCEKCGRLPAN